MLTRALEGLNGVEDATVSFRGREARVRFDPKVVTVERLIEVVNRFGFRASLKRVEGSGS
ncbi:MAG: cation transporter [Candidatus Methylomirabilia bacterium]